MLENKKKFYIIVGILIFAFVAMIVLMIVQDKDDDIATSTNIPTNLTNTALMSISQYSFPGILDDARIKDKKVTITTDKGAIVFELYSEDAPNTVSNFVYLAEEGYYDGLVFHRVEPGFVIQGGDPKGDGTGGPGYSFDDETVTKEYDKGIVAMANAGPNTNGSQFFIMLEDNDTLPKSYTIFGKVIEGQDVVDAIAVGDVMTSVTVEDK